MVKPNQNFRPDPTRSINVFGQFDEKLISDVAPQILRLREEGTKPITVYINSGGGSVRCLETLFALLTASNTNGKRSRIITVAIGIAGSAAATLLAMGDYAIAYPDAGIHFHGIRLSEAENVTMEDAADYAQWSPTPSCFIRSHICLQASLKSALVSSNTDAMMQ